MKEEMVLVIRRSLLESLGIFQGLQFDVDRYLSAMLARENNFFTPRSSAETNPALKQIIPYVILSSRGKILRYRKDFSRWITTPILRAFNAKLMKNSLLNGQRAVELERSLMTIPMRWVRFISA
jgi:hypothetical protein